MELVFGKPDFAEPDKKSRNRKRVGLARRRIVGDYKGRLDNLSMGLGSTLDIPSPADMAAFAFVLAAVEIAL